MTVVVVLQRYQAVGYVRFMNYHTCCSGACVPTKAETWVSGHKHVINIPGGFNKIDD